ncbi:hypothetical protein CSC70_01320 [Pseudoxanthomonas kalamensis DSM 18571]|uniref:uroporphyrinogen-III C-methyltransferase n=1 Tax=Pseudoxanthomonas kalamensis TaxID=289483 RepID=UPI001390AB72|nr:uroporphyrinogen-III C-methyltransferase [Pseudoxanthomonas kalamensis]KAF1712201.1 hypothetical protein CSC70_01320 [Pseudoxanthomonas kalamensis DSM 18571]
MNEEDTTVRTRLPWRWILALVVLALIGLAVWRGWAWWQARNAGEQVRLDAAEQRIEALEARVESLNRESRAQAQRLQSASASQQVLRDEVLGLGQRNDLLQESIDTLVRQDREGPQAALRLDEAELLLSLAGERLTLADDPAAARRAYALAAGILDSLDNPRLLNLKQALAQERAAAEALGDGPQAALGARLDALESRLDAIPHAQAATDAAARPAWQRALAPLVDIRPSQDNPALSPNDRSAGVAALKIELALARAALERGDDAAFDRALERVQTWLPRLWPESAALQHERTELAALRAAPLRPADPVLGSSLQQLRALRESTMRDPAPTTPAAKEATP